ncbi:MAG TPA: NAD(P)/FAD-dependent oxidoreductase, partial [Polyangiales bacterium]|nr:NAD(P)/FAD-dependent oxidoreductase [Polyangiales bacterium]
MTTDAATQARPLRFVIIGAGLSGIMSAIELERAGFDDIVIYEKAERLGGTWRDNTYPGVACDVPSHLYSYSFAPNPHWSRLYSPGHEILAYIQGVASRYGVERRMRFGEEVTRCELLDGRWQIETVRGRRDVADVVIAATGVTHHPNLPELPGLGSFEGPCFHSARWDHGVSVDGLKVGVVGTGSTSAQLVPALVERAARVVLFQRTAQWVMPQENPAYSAEDRAKFEADPQRMLGLRAELARRFAENFSDAVVDVNSRQLKVIEDACRNNLDTQVQDPELRERLRPSYRPACKRLVISPDFYRAIQQPNAQLVSDGIERIEPRGVRTRDGQLHELDVLVLATGFRTDRFVRPTEVIGSAGRRLDELWGKHPSAYYSVAVPGFPNLFLLNGPSSPVGNFSLIEVAEIQMRYVLQLIELLRAGRCRQIAVSEQAAAAFEAERSEAT